MAITLGENTYNTVKALHVVAAIAGYGLMFIYPVLVPFLRRTAPKATEGVHLAMQNLYQRVIQVAMIVALVAGGLLISQVRWKNQQQALWSVLPIVILLSLMVMSGIAAGWEAKAATLARIDVDRALADRVVWGDAYRAISARLLAFNVVAAGLVTAAAWMMTTKLPAA